MKVFNQEITNCRNCNLFDEEFMRCNYTDIELRNYDDEGNEIFYEYNDIHKTCPFNKPLTKEDIESFGFIQTESETFWNKYISDDTLYIIYHNQFKIIISYAYNNDDKSKYNIQSKPHLEFILNSLDII